MRIERRSLLVVGGLPGAGKSTLLRATMADGPITVLDTDQVRARLLSLVPAGTPYSWYRPLVHLLHRARLVSSAAGVARPLVVHDPATGRTARLAFVLLGVLTRRPRHLLWIDCTVDDALSGQRSRGRVLRGRSFARHIRNAPRLRERVLTGDAPPGWRNVTVIDRATARRGLRLEVNAGAANS